MQLGAAGGRAAGAHLVLGEGDQQVTHGVLQEEAQGRVQHAAGADGRGGGGFVVGEGGSGATSAGSAARLLHPWQQQAWQAALAAAAGSQAPGTHLCTILRHMCWLDPRVHQWKKEPRQSMRVTKAATCRGCAGGGSEGGTAEHEGDGRPPPARGWAGQGGRGLWVKQMGRGQGIPAASVGGVLRKADGLDKLCVWIKGRDRWACWVGTAGPAAWGPLGLLGGDRWACCAGTAGPAGHPPACRR